jgi:hypothetical protein
VRAAVSRISHTLAPARTQYLFAIWFIYSLTTQQLYYSGLLLSNSEDPIKLQTDQSMFPQDSYQQANALQDFQTENLTDQNEDSTDHCSFKVIKMYNHSFHSTNSESLCKCLGHRLPKGHPVFYVALVPGPRRIYRVSQLTWKPGK